MCAMLATEFLHPHLYYGWDWPMAERLALADTYDYITKEPEDTSFATVMSILGREYQKSVRRKRSESDYDMPVVFMKQGSSTECIPRQRLSSWGFLSFIVATLNGVVQVANNINNNNNNRNNNNNDNNNNQVNTNVANQNNQQTGGGMAMAMAAGRTVRFRKGLLEAVESQSEVPITQEAMRLMEKMYTNEENPLEFVPPETGDSGLPPHIMALMRELVAAQSNDTFSESSEDLDRYTRSAHPDEGITLSEWIFLDDLRQQIRNEQNLQANTDLAAGLIYDASLVSIAWIEAWIILNQTNENIDYSGVLSDVHCACVRLGPAAEEVSRSCALRVSELLSLYIDKDSFFNCQKR